MSSNPLRLKQLLGKYLQNTISQAELDEFWVLMSRLSENDLVDSEIAKFWNDQSLLNKNAVEWEDVYTRLQQKMNKDDIDYNQIINPRYRKLKQFAIAASILFLVVLSSLFINHPSRNKTSDAGLSTHGSYDLQVIRLADGTTVTLNQNSKLNYPASFNGATREVYLYGEAFFDVKHNPSKPFLVHTGNFVTRVLGTAFNIKAYDSDNEIAVTVSSGKVQVQGNNTDKILGLLSAGDHLTVDKKAENISQTKVDVRNVLTWKTKDLVFDNKTVDEAAVIISNYFGVEIKFENEALRKCRFTANFSSNENSITEVMDVITVLTASGWTKYKEGVFLITGKGCE